MNAARSPRGRDAVGPARSRALEAAEALGVGTVLLVYWGTTSVLARCCGKDRAKAEKSVHRET